jgi:hypothetical protein
MGRIGATVNRGRAIKRQRLPARRWAAASDTMAPQAPITPFDLEMPE